MIDIAACLTALGYVLLALAWTGIRQRKEKGNESDNC